MPATLKRLADHHLQMPCLNSSITLVTPMSIKWDAMLGECRRYTQLSQHSGTKFLRIFGGTIPAAMTREDARQLAQDHLGQLVDICKPHGCKPLLETHDSWVTHSAILDLIGIFSADQVGVLWDLEHPFRSGEMPTITASKLKERIEHVHIKDTLRRHGKSIPMLLGQGELPLTDCLAELRKMNYPGWICLETEKRWHTDGPEPEQSLPQFADYIRSNG